MGVLSKLAVPIQLAKLGLKVRRKFRNWRQRRRNLKNSGQERPPMLKGKLTYSALAVMAIVTVGQWAGVGVAEAEAATLVQAGAVVVAIYGRWRATR